MTLALIRRYGFRSWRRPLPPGPATHWPVANPSPIRPRPLRRRHACAPSSGATVRPCPARAGSGGARHGGDERSRRRPFGQGRRHGGRGRGSWRRRRNLRRCHCCGRRYRCALGLCRRLLGRYGQPGWRRRCEFRLHRQTIRLHRRAFRWHIQTLRRYRRNVWMCPCRHPFPANDVRINNKTPISYGKT